MASQLRILATSVAGLPAALDAALGRLQATITQTVLDAVRERISDEIDDALAALPPSGGSGGGGGGGGRRGSVVVDVGRIPVSEFWTIVADPAVRPDSYVFGWIAATAPGKDDDETAMDVIDVWFAPGEGELELRLTGLTGRIADAFRINYLIAEG